VRRIPPPVNALQAGIDCLRRPFQLAGDFRGFHSGIQHFPELILLGCRPASSRGSWSGSFTLSDRAGLPRRPPPADSVRSRWRCFEALLPLRNRRPTVWCLCGKPKQETEVSLRTAVARELSDDDLAAIAIGGEDEKDPTRSEGGFVETELIKTILALAIKADL
jgi:hypothetical protein